jgi:hypothetical protein
MKFYLLIEEFGVPKLCFGSAPYVKHRPEHCALHRPLIVMVLFVPQNDIQEYFDIVDIDFLVTI